MENKNRRWDLDGLIDAFEAETGSTITSAQVRRYLEEGLIPVPEEEGSFGELHLERLRMVEHLRSRYGMSLKDIAGIFGAVMSAREGKAPATPEEEKQATDRRQRIIANASGLFAARGYHGTTIDEIVQATGIAKGTFYIYFNSKEELLVEVMKQLIDTTLEKIDVKLKRRKKRDPITDIEIKGEEFMQLYLKNSELLYMLIGETVGNPRLMDQLEGVYRQMAETVEEDLGKGVEAGKIYPYPDLKTISYAIVGMGQSVAFMLSMDSEPQLEKARRTMQKFMQRAFMIDSKE